MNIGDVIGGRYALARRIGAGGMGEVWQADDRTLRRTVALKLLHPALAADESFRLRFQQEARTVAALNAPGVVDIYDIGEAPAPGGGVLTYLVMELVEGRSLADILDRGPLPTRQAVPLMIGVAEALDAAHRAGVVHRDVKPGNILVSGDGKATIVDFGIAYRSDQTSLTATGTVLGTVGYASPEQLEGRPLTGSSDLYSLAVVAYECLSGSTPFRHPSAAAVISGHLRDAPPPLPEAVPGPVAAVVMTALAKQPAQRPASAGAFAKALAATADPSQRTTAHLAPGPAATTVTPAQMSPTRLSPAADGPGTPPTEPLPGAAEPPNRRRGLVWKIVAVLAAVALTVAAMRFWWPPDDPAGPEGGIAGSTTGGEQTPTGGTETSDGAEESPEPDPDPELPVGETVVVNHGTGGCLQGYSNEYWYTAKVEGCDGSGIEVFSFETNGHGVVQIRYEDEDFDSTEDDSDLSGCVEPGDEGEAVYTTNCDPWQGWVLTYLKTDEEEDADFWKVEVAGAEGTCLTADSPATVLAPCDDLSDYQRWRTVSG